MQINILDHGVEEDHFTWLNQLVTGYIDANDVYLHSISDNGLKMKNSTALSPHPYEHIESLGHQITELAAHIHAATYRLLVLIHEYDNFAGWEGPGMKSCAHWLNWKCGISLGAAREKVRVAHALAELPKISAAFRRGQVSYSKVRAMTRVADCDNEDYLLMIARHGTATHMERLVRQFRRVERIEMLEKEAALRSHRKLDWFVDDHGSVGSRELSGVMDIARQALNHRDADPRGRYRCPVCPGI